MLAPSARAAKSEDEGLRLKIGSCCHEIGPRQTKRAASRGGVARFVVHERQPLPSRAGLSEESTGLSPSQIFSTAL
jgi:hypothetical protein